MRILRANNLLILILLLALVLRFLYFPGNIFFAYDQSRDAYTSLEVMSGHLKIIGPPSSYDTKLFHGPLFYYLFGPIYWLSSHSPIPLSALLRIYNAGGIFLAYFLGKVLFNRRAGLLSALIFALSFEQSQYAIFLSHPALAVITVSLFYLGLAILIFDKKSWGLPLATLGLGLSIQFHVGLSYLILLVPINLIIFKSQLPKIQPKTYFQSFLILLVTLSTFMIAEIKFHFRETQAILSELSLQNSSTSDHLTKLLNLQRIFLRFFHDNIYSGQFTALALLIFVILLLAVYVKNFKSRPQINFLLIWFITGLLPFYLSGSNIYYYSIGASVSLIILAGFLTSLAFDRSKILGFFLILGLLISNLNLITTYNPTGPLPSITAQKGMILSDELKVIDKTYQVASGQPFAVNALTVPYNVNTTWSYLYDWYGKSHYHYLPIWGGNNAPGYQNSLTINNSRSTLPTLRFLILEPTYGIKPKLIEDFLREEGYFTKEIDRIKYGELTLIIQQER